MVKYNNLFNLFFYRVELCMILKDESIHRADPGSTLTPSLTYEEVAVDRLSGTSHVLALLEKYADTPRYKEIYVDLVSK